MPEQPEGLEPNGMLKPPTAHEKTEIKSEALAKAEQEQIPMKMLTLDESDLLRAQRAFMGEYDYKEDDVNIIYGLKEHGYGLSEFIIKNCPPGKERSQALGQVHAAVLWATASIDCKAR